MSGGKKITRRAYLTRKALIEGHGMPIAQISEAVATTLLEHPELDPDETRTWEEWEASGAPR